MTKPISIIIPCFNHGSFLLDAIASLETCNADLFEVIIVNDGSDEQNTLQILKTLEKKYEVINQLNAGLGAARNRGVRASQSDFILPLDADNLLYPNYLTGGLKILESDPQIGVVYAKRKFFGDGNFKKYRQPGKFNLESLIVDNYIDACALIRKSALLECGGFATDLPEQGLEDWDLWLSMVERKWKFSFLDEVAYAYRVRDDSMTSIMMEEESSKANIEYLSRKHAMLLREIVIDQFYELRRHRSWIPYSLRYLIRNLYYFVKTK